MTQHLVSLHVFRVSSIFGLEQVGNVVVRLRGDPLRRWCNAYGLGIEHLLLGTSELFHASLVFLS